MARSTFPQRLVKLAGMIAWAIFDGRFEPDAKRRIPCKRALSFAWSNANILGNLGIRRSDCGCQRRFGHLLVVCGHHARLDD